MDEATKRALLAKNQKIIDMVIERAKRDFPDDISLIGLTGSFGTGDFHERSDLDLIIVNETERGWKICRCFILGDVGYDVYCTPWSPRLEAQSRLESPMLGCLLDMEILYCARPEAMEKLEALRRRALDELAKGFGPDCVARARKRVDEAKRRYAELALAQDLCDARFAAGKMLLSLVDAIVQLNDDYIRRGVKRYKEELSGYDRVPPSFFQRWEALVAAKGMSELRDAALSLLACVDGYCAEIDASVSPSPHPTRESLRGTYEELWCNCRNKILNATQSGDTSYAFLAGIGAQDFLDEMSRDKGTTRIKLMQAFEADDLEAFASAFLAAMDKYLEEYKKVSLEVERYESLDELYASFMAEGQEKTR